MIASSLLFSYCRNLTFFNGCPALEHAKPEHCGAFKILNYNIAYRVSVIVRVTTIYMQREWRFGSNLPITPGDTAINRVTTSRDI